VRVSFQTVKIPNGGTDTPVQVVPTGCKLVGVQIPAGMTSTTIAFKAGMDDASTAPVFNDATVYNFAITSAARFIRLTNPITAKNVVVSVGTAEAAERTLILAFEG
jgi:hypothetical protein